MTPAARLSAAIEVLADIEARRRPAADALKDWGLSHRFAGSKDRAAIASLVYDGLRRKASAAWLMDDPSPRAAIIGTLRLERGLQPDGIAALFSGEGHAPPPLSEAEQERLASGSLDGAPAHVAGDCPEWIAPSLARAFGDDLVAELQALAARAPLDIRVNTLKASAGGGEGGACASRPGRDAAFAARPPHRPGRGRARTGAAGRAGIPERLVRDPGRGLAARGAADAGESRRAGRRSVRRRRRQDPGARCPHGQCRPDLRDRRGTSPPGADPRAPEARRRPQRAGAHAARSRRRRRRSRRPHRLRPRRRALHRLRHLAPQPGREVASAPRQPWRCAAGSRRPCSTGRRGSPGRAGASST